jgi:hypothetical protein
MDPAYAKSLTHKATADQGLPTSHKASPSFLQQLFSCGKSLTKLAKYALMASAILSPESTVSASAKSSEILPLLYSTPWTETQYYTSMAFNPHNKREFAFGGINQIAIINVDKPDNPVILQLDKECDGVIDMNYNPQGTLLASNCYGPVSIWDVESKTVTHSLNYSTDEGLFDTTGTKYVMRNGTIGIYDLSTNSVTQAHINGEEPFIINLARAYKTNTFAHNTPDGTFVWHLDNPSQALEVKVDPRYTTLFRNEKELFSYTFGGQNIQFTNITDPNNQTVRSLQIKDGWITRGACSEKLKKCFYTTTGNGLGYLVLSTIDPDNLETKRLWNFTNFDHIQFSPPTFSPDGETFFSVAHVNSTTLQFAYMDLKDLMKQTIAI